MFWAKKTVSSFKSWQYLWHLIAYAPRLYTIDSLFWIFINGLPAVPGLIVREFFNALTGESLLGLSAWTLLALLLATALAQIVILFAGRLTKTQHRFIISALLRRNLWEEILKHPGKQSSNISPGEAISYFRDDILQIEDNIAAISEVGGSGLFALVSLAILLSVNARITLLVFLPLMGMMAVVRQAETRIKRYRRASRQATEQVTGLVGEMFTAIQAIQVAGAESSVLEHFRQVNDRRRQLMVRDQLLSALLNSLFQNMLSFGTGLILLFASQMIQGGQKVLTVGDFALFVYNLAFVSEFFHFFGWFMAYFQQTEVSFERLTTFFSETSPDVLVAHQPLYLGSLWEKPPKLPPVEQPEPRESDRLEELRLCDLTYYYPSTEQGIENINLTLRRGSFTVITGSIGAGKTTLLRVLLGLLPKQKGEIYWNQQLIQDPGKFFIPPRSAYTPQIPQLFSDTLRTNLLLGLNKEEKDLREALKLAIFEQDLALMPEGLDTLVGSKGVRLSGGQIQRAAAARMFLRRPELLVFDDLSSALDVETEQRLWQRLFASCDQGKEGDKLWQPTCLIVSYRPSILRRADQIVVLKGGKILATGNLDELLENCQEMQRLLTIKPE